MSLDMDQIAEVFCSYKFGETYLYMAREIKWKALPNFRIRKIKPQTWPAVMSFNFQMGNLSRLHSMYLDKS
jgi:hypothetical protein